MQGCRGTQTEFMILDGLWAMALGSAVRPPPQAWEDTQAQGLDASSLVASSGPSQGQVAKDPLRILTPAEIASPMTALRASPPSIT